MKDRYSRNFNSLTYTEHLKIRDTTVLIVGNGGLGGYLIDFISRLGVKKIKLVDFDKFDITNLNRQLISREDNIGCSKVEESKNYIKNINSSIIVETFNLKFENCNFIELFSCVDIVFDCCDNIFTKLKIENECSTSNIPLIYGAVAGFFGQASIIYPKSPILSKIYPSYFEIINSYNGNTCNGNSDGSCSCCPTLKGIESTLGNISSTVAMVSSIQVSLFIKWIKKIDIIKTGFYYIDVDSLEIQWIDIET